MVKATDIKKGDWLINDPVNPTRIYQADEAYPAGPDRREDTVYCTTPLNNVYGGVLYCSTLHPAPADLVEAVQKAVEALRQLPAITTPQPKPDYHISYKTGRTVRNRVDMELWRNDHIKALQEEKTRYGVPLDLYLGPYTG